MDRRDVLGALGALSLSGCLRLQEDGAGAAGDGNDLPDDVSYPTGLSEDRVSPALAEAHTQGVSGTTVELDWSVAGELGNANDESLRVRLGNEIGVGEFSERGIGPIEVYGTPEEGIWRFVPEDEPIYGTLADRDTLGFLTRQDRIEELVRAGDWSAPTYDADAETFTVEADGVDEGGPLSESLDADSMEAFSGTIVMDQWNRIHDLTVDYEYVVDGDVLPETASLSMTERDGDPSEPDWADDGRANRPDVEMDVADDRRMVRVRMRGGTPVPGQRVRIDLRNPEGVHRATLEEPLRGGDDLYLAVENGSLRTTREESELTDADPERFAELRGPVSVTAAWILSFFHLRE